jgi:hypothetical protein
MGEPITQRFPDDGPLLYRWTLVYVDGVKRFTWAADERTARERGERRGALSEVRLSREDELPG